MYSPQQKLNSIPQERLNRWRHLKEAASAHAPKGKENTGKSTKHLQKAIGGDAAFEPKAMNATFKILSYYFYYITVTLKHF